MHQLLVLAGVEEEVAVDEGDETEDEHEQGVTLAVGAGHAVDDGVERL